jgi:hypothetical protein
MGLAAVAGGVNAVDIFFDTERLPDAFDPCAGCVRESLDAAGVAFDCRPIPDDTELQP